MARKLATLRRVTAVDPIPGADAIEVATVGGWKVVIKKGEFAPGDLAVYFEIDSLLPVREEFEFLRRSSYRKTETQEGFRLRTIKLRGQVSQGLLVPPSEFESEIPPDAAPGDDLTEALGVVLWEPPIPASLAGVVRGPWPTGVPKTDEERVQNLDYDALRALPGPWYVTEKLDGSSMTVYITAYGDFGVCSRNLNLAETESNALWTTARRLDLEAGMRRLLEEHHARQEGERTGLYVQGELVGPGIQGNPYKQTRPDFFLFNVGQMRQPRRSSLGVLEETAERLGVRHVPVVERSLALPERMEELIAAADGTSALGAGRREGFVVREDGGETSFKVISNRFLLKAG
jgi:RNA ligase (TIGR02306 family)